MFNGSNTFVVGKCGKRYALWKYGNYASRIFFESLDECKMYCDICGMKLLMSDSGWYYSCGKVTKITYTDTY